MTAIAPSIAVSLWDLPAQLGQVFYFIVMPILILAGIGFLIQRTCRLDLPTLTRLNFNFVIPGMIYFSASSSRLSAADAGAVVLATLALMACMGVLTLAAARLRGVPRDQRNAMVMTTIYYNSGNYGLPLQELAFRNSGQGAPATALQSIVMITQNFTNFTFGVMIATGGRKDRHWRQNLMHVVKFPPIYALAAAILTTYVRGWIGESPHLARAIDPFWKVVLYVKDAFIAVALLTLGAQLATVRPSGKSYPVRLSIFLRLLVGPATALAIIYALGLEGFLAQVLLISSSTPTAVNTMLLCMEFDNHPDYAARAVFYSTLLSPVTITLVVFLAQGGHLARLEAGSIAQSGWQVLALTAADTTAATDPAAAAGPSTSAPRAASTKGATMKRRTTVSIEAQAFLINGKPTYQGRKYNGMKIEGLLMNARLVQGIFDDLNPQTRAKWNYPDGPWDPNRNTEEFLAAMPTWRKHGLLSFTINLQGGSPQGYSKEQPWHNSAFAADGSLRGDYMARLERILDKADELGMAPIVGFFYFGQDERLSDEKAVVRAVQDDTDWLLEKGYANVLVEIANEVNVNRYEHKVIQPPRCHELIELVRKRSAGKVSSPAGRLLVSTSMGGGAIPPENIVKAADFLLLHGNGVSDPNRIRAMVDQCRALKSYAGQPILFNEDDHFGFEAADNNMLAAVSRYAGWGYFDYRMKGEGYDEGFQSVPVNWTISSARKRGFFNLLAKMTGQE